jgi:hypothetical protein
MVQLRVALVSALCIGAAAFTVIPSKINHVPNKFPNYRFQERFKPLLTFRSEKFRGEQENAYRSAQTSPFRRIHVARYLRSSNDVTVVEGPFEGQFGLWFVSDDDAKVRLWAISQF